MDTTLDAITANDQRIIALRKDIAFIDEMMNDGTIVDAIQAEIELIDDASMIDEIAFMQSRMMNASSDIIESDMRIVFDIAYLIMRIDQSISNANALRIAMILY